MGWGGDVNVRLKLNTPLMLRWAWADPDQYIRSWQWRWENALCPDLLKKTAQVYMHNDHWNWQGKKRSGFRVEGLPNAGKITFFKRCLLRDGYETLKGLSVFDNGDAPTRAIPHPAWCLCICVKCAQTYFTLTYDMLIYVICRAKWIYFVNPQSCSSRSLACGSWQWGSAWGQPAPTPPMSRALTSNRYRSKETTYTKPQTNEKDGHLENMGATSSI